MLPFGIPIVPSQGKQSICWSSSEIIQFFRTSTGSSSAAPQATPEQLARLQELLTGMTGPSALAPG